MAGGVAGQELPRHPRRTRHRHRRALPHPPRRAPQVAADHGRTAHGHRAPGARRPSRRPQLPGHLHEPPPVGEPHLRHLQGPAPAGQGRLVHDRGTLPQLPRQTPQAGGAGGDRRRAGHRVRHLAAARPALGLPGRRARPPRHAGPPRRAPAGRARADRRPPGAVVHPDRPGPRVPGDRAHHLHPLRRRTPAAAHGHPAPQRPLRRAVRPGRALGRAARLGHGAAAHGSAAAAGSGNSVFVVEHNAQVLASADWIVDMGPGAGRHGGRVLHNGPARELSGAPGSVTARYLSAEAPAAPGPEEPRKPRAWLRLRGVTGNNLHDLDAEFPLATLTAVTGVSGSGKSTLVRRALAETAREHLHGDGAEADRPAAEAAEEEGDGIPAWAPAGDRVTVRSSSGLEHVDRLVVVDQKPIGRTPRSNLATYTGLFDSVRKLYAAQPTARELGYTASRFSFNVPQGRCPHCLGDGVVSVELLFLPTETSPCPVCHGARYNPGTLLVRHRERTIADVLAMSVEEAREFLHDVQPAARILNLLSDIGLGYLTLGQSATTLSGGEAQRIKLVSELHRAPRGHSLYLLDEPTSGLHPADVDLLVGHLQRLVDDGNTVVVAEHDLRTVAAADWLMDLGPGAGDDGGRIVAQGRPADVAREGGTATADHLARYLANRAGGA
ncbi:ATP-binding cassette domain-containing protein [Streptomyces sp. AD16]|nr:ATP-binding cassette domain-containing protein [Streptomyces sp. AD16]